MREIMRAHLEDAAPLSYSLGVVPPRYEDEHKAAPCVVGMDAVSTGYQRKVNACALHGGCGHRRYCIWPRLCTLYHAREATRDPKYARGGARRLAAPAYSGGRMFVRNEELLSASLAK